MINTLTICGQISDKQQHFYLCIFYVKALILNIISQCLKLPVT